jgi:hypothetical protein
MIISINIEKAFNKIQHPFVVGWCQGSLPSHAKELAPETVD